MAGVVCCNVRGCEGNVCSWCKHKVHHHIDAGIGAIEGENCVVKVVYMLVVTTHAMEELDDKDVGIHASQMLLCSNAIGFWTCLLNRAR